ncbi:hypothetical protein AWE51_14025 [Aquimarina aggregata]|uniref:Uncharacterized protein n=1 Tax=Aquimarina aggregata TaxID=1642818 RepID=A0A162XLS6_9FLAO|nr:hypothetical protein [Aquimarina aggregata]KZS38702.1 hypothetical protein AWE51_14025 [Aquimarina aggregata]
MKKKLSLIFTLISFVVFSQNINEEKETLYLSIDNHGEILNFVEDKIEYSYSFYLRCENNIGAQIGFKNTKGKEKGDYYYSLNIKPLSEIINYFLDIKDGNTNRRKYYSLMKYLSKYDIYFVKKEGKNNIFYNVEPFIQFE